MVHPISVIFCFDEIRNHGDIYKSVGCRSGNYNLQFAQNVSTGVAIYVDLSRAMLKLLVGHAQIMIQPGKTGQFFFGSYKMVK